MYIHINNHSGASNQTLREIPAVLRNTRGMRGEHTRWLFFSVPNSVKAKTKNSRYFETTTVCTRETQVGETYLRCSPLPLRRRVLDKLSPSSVRINDRAISPLMGGGVTYTGVKCLMLVQASCAVEKLHLRDNYQSM